MTRKHTLLMILGCLLPIAALVAIFLFQVQVNTIILVAIILLCPILHLLMMRDHAGHAAHHQVGPDEKVDA
jgi:hypothetical protein